MTLSLTTKQKMKGPFEKAKANVETLANNLYYTLTLNNYIMKLQSMPLPIHLTIDELIENNYIVGNLVTADCIIQQSQMISA
jgi:UDP-N-acetylglucosamine pyrophosphorylase